MYAIRSYYDARGTGGFTGCLELAVFPDRHKTAQFTVCNHRDGREASGLTATEPRITSYNVCYTKLLRVLCWLAMFKNN